jgi:hypothetical protein
MPVALPVEALVHHHALGYRRSGVGTVRVQVGVLAATRDVGEDVAALPAHCAFNRLGIWVDEQLRGVEAVPAAGVVRAMHAVGVALARPHAG